MQGVSYSTSTDLTNWKYEGRTESGENVCVLVEDDQYVLFHSPSNGIGIMRSKDLKNWTHEKGLITLGQKDWPWAQNRLTAGVVLNLRNVEGIDNYVMFFQGGGPGKEKTQDNVSANCNIGIAWSPDLKTWDWPGKEEHSSAELAMHDGDWKLLMRPDGSEIKLFNLATDPGEKSNLAAKNPETVQRMRKQLDAWWREMDQYYKGY